MTLFSRSKAGGGSGFARYNYQWSQIGLRISSKRVAVGVWKFMLVSSPGRRQGRSIFLLQGGSESPLNT